MTRVDFVSDTRRAGTVALCCVLATFAPFIGGVRMGAVGLLPLGYALWVVSRSTWSNWTRVAVVLAAVAVAVGLAIGLLILVTASSGD